MLASWTGRLVNMKKQALSAIEIDALTPSTLTAPDERREPVSLDGGDYSPKPETRRRAALRRFIDTLAFAVVAMAGVNVSVWPDEPNVSGDQTSRKEETSPRRQSRDSIRVEILSASERTSPTPPVSGPAPGDPA
jgi:hypothetical protein